MLEINVTIHCPELLALAEALSAGKAPAPAAPAPTAAPAPMMPTPGPAPMTAPVAPAAPAAPVAPVAAAPAYTLEQIAQAGAGLLRDNPGLLPQMTGLLQRFGLQAVSELKADQIPAFADALKALGAKL